MASMSWIPCAATLALLLTSGPVRAQRIYELVVPDPSTPRPIGTANEDSDPRGKRGVIATCELYYGTNPAQSCSKLPASRIPPSRMTSSWMRPGPLIPPPERGSLIPRGRHRIGVFLPPSQLPRTRIPPSRIPVWPAQRWIYR